ncbi:MAG: hypothetical protein Q4D98_02120 [Planctomycetia bacterium]|nr:hypothetical protein [Planctomycetia bacterium]
MWGSLAGGVYHCVLAVVFSQLDERVLNRLGTEDFDQVTCGEKERDFLGTALRFRDVELLHSQEADSRRNMMIQDLYVDVSPLFWGRNLNVREVRMDGVRFPLLSAGGTWKNPTLPVVGFTEDAQKRMDARLERLESLVYLEGVRETYLPKYESLARQLRAFSAEAEEIQAEMVSLLGTSEMTQKLVDEHPEEWDAVRTKVERLVAIRTDSENVKTQWSDLNKQVAADLSKVQDKITCDGQAFSEMLKGTVPTEEALSADLFSTDAQRKLNQSAACVDALCDMVFAAMGTGETPAQSVKTSGEIDLFGQRFSFSGNWNTQTQEGYQRSFFGTLQLTPTDGTARPGNDATLRISCREKANLRQKSLTATLPLVQENRTWGSPRSFALDSYSQGGQAQLDLTFYNDEVRGSMTLVRSGLTLAVPHNGTPCKAIQEYVEKQTRSEKDALTVEVAVSGTLKSPKLECRSAWAAELIPVYTAAMKELSRQKRSELIAKVYEKLKNAETMFNCSIDPFYQDMVACSDKIVRITESMSKGIVFRDSQGSAYEVPDLPISDRELSEILAMEEDGELPQYDPTLGTESEVTSQIGSRVETPETGFHAKFVPVKKVNLIAEMSDIPAPDASKPLPVPVAVSPMDPAVFEKSPHIQHAETPLPVAAKEPDEAKAPVAATVPNDPLDIQLPELDENLQPIRPAASIPETSTSPAAPKPRSNMPVPAMRSTTRFKG